MSSQFSDTTIEGQPTFKVKLTKLMPGLHQLPHIINNK